LALYREALNMRRFHSQPYAVLGFYKIVETTFGGHERKAFLEEAIARMLANRRIRDYHLKAIGFSQASSPSDIASFLYQDGRHAVAHAQKAPHIDPDDIGQVRSMSVAASILRDIARQYIIDVLGVGTNRWQQ
jgi:hypothetical protein